MLRSAKKSFAFDIGKMGTSMTLSFGGDSLNRPASANKRTQSHQADASSSASGKSRRLTRVSLVAARENGSSPAPSQSRMALADWKSTRIAIKAKGRILLIDAAEVVAVEAKGNYVLLHLKSTSHMLRESISVMEETLNPHGFVRIHRSVLVNAALVQEIQREPMGEYMLRVSGGRDYRVARTYKKNLQLLAHSWVGMDGFAVD